MIFRSSPPESRSVLIVDRSEESREVFRVALQRQGTQILEASSAEAGLELAERHRPGVIVLDLEAEEADHEQLRRLYDDHSARQNTSLLLLGAVSQKEEQQPTPGDARRQIVSKPYHYRPLIRTIQQLLDNEIQATRIRTSGAGGSTTG